MAENSNTNKEIKLRELLTKKPFTRIMPDGHQDHGYTFDGFSEVAPTTDRLHRKIVTQEDFLRELDPAGHLINDRQAFPDIWRQNDDDGKWYVEEIPRYAFSFQRIILIKQLTHLCGNDIQFELSNDEVDDDSTDTFNAFRNGWANKNMEVAWYKFAKSVKATGDGAFVGYLDNGKFGWKVLTFLNGDKLYPHYDLKTGKLITLARTYSNYNEDGTVKNRYIDVWDDEYYYRFVADGDPKNIVDKAKHILLKLFRVDGYKLDAAPEKHGFDRIPVSYLRDDNGPCWTFSQESIENFEIAFSNLAQSNHDFGLPIMYVKGEGSDEVTTNDMSYASKIMILPSDGDIGFLNRQDASNAYKSELDKLEDMIYKQSFAVKTPELKSGDTPGVALKIMYSDAYEKAMNDAHEYDDAVDDMVYIYSWGYGIESEKRLKFINTSIRHYLEPYIHLNLSELINNLNVAVIGGFLSKQTATEKHPYATPQEWSRIQKEKHDEQMHELLIEEQRLEIQSEKQVEVQEEISDIQTENQIDVIKAQNEIQDEDKDSEGKKTKKKYSVATGRGVGRPRTVNTDKFGNRPNENNWRKWDQTH